jgi:hypothetical protein
MTRSKIITAHMVVDYFGIDLHCVEGNEIMVSKRRDISQCVDINEAATMLNVSRRRINAMLDAKMFVGAFQDASNRGKWWIPIGEVANYQKKPARRMSYPTVSCTCSVVNDDPMKHKSVCKLYRQAARKNTSKA